MASLDMTSFAAALKVHYTPQRVQNMVYRDNPLLAMVSKYEQFGGKNLPIPIKYGIPQGRSATFATAQANKTASKYKDFVLTRVKDYAIASIDNETLEASKGNANAFLEAATSEIDGAIQSATRSLAISMYRPKSGSIGRIANSISADPVITLSDIESVTNFEVGQVLAVSSTDGGGSVRATVRTIIAVDRDLGTVTMDSNLNSSTTWVQNDYLFIQGDYDSKLSGLLSWIPSTAPDSTAFFGVDRSADVTRLGGIRFDGSALPIEEALIGAASRAAREGGKPDYCFMSYNQYANLEKALGSKVQYVDMKVNPEIGFRGILINGPRGAIKVVPDQNCPSDRAFMLQLDSWKLYSLGKAPQMLDSDGNKMLREASADAVEVRVGYYAQLGCNSPGHNVNVKLS
jgi:hypothetical protein